MKDVLIMLMESNRNYYKQNGYINVYTDKINLKYQNDLIEEFQSPSQIKESM